MANNMKLIETQNVPEIQAVSEWCRQIGRSLVTVWRWKENGWITTINIAGRPYITRVTRAIGLRWVGTVRIGLQHPGCEALA
jgi:hypothetical protein